MRKQNIAVITNGGAVGGHFNQGVPALVELFDRLGERYELTVYQASRVSEVESQARRFAVKTFGPKFTRTTLLMTLLRDHLRSRYSLIHGLWLGSGLTAVRAASILNLPVVVSLLGGEVASVPEIGYGGLLSERRVTRLKDVCRRAAAVTTTSEFQDAKLKEILQVESRVIPLGVDNSKFVFREPVLEPPYRFIHVANLTEVKDQATLIRAFEVIHGAIDSHLTVVGPDYLNGQLQELVAALGLTDHVTFTGPIPNLELPKFYRDAHLLLHSSLYESEAVVAVEAMSCGVVVCGTTVGILADLNEKCCLAVPPKDFRGLARTVLDLIDDQRRIARLRNASRAWANEHSAQWTADRYSDLYRSLIEP